MKEHTWMRSAILVFWTLFWGLSVVDKIIPDVQHLWVGKDFFALFVKFFASLGLKDPLFPTVALAGVSGLEALNFTMYAVALWALWRGRSAQAEVWFFRGIFTSMGLFSLFSIADQVFGDRFQLLEQAVLGHPALLVDPLQILLGGIRARRRPRLHSAGRSSLGWVDLGGHLVDRDFSASTFDAGSQPVKGEEVVEDVWKFDFPFLADKLVWERTVNAFTTAHPELEVTYIYTGPSELNTKKKTHLLLYVFTEPRQDH